MNDNIHCFFLILHKKCCFYSDPTHDMIHYKVRDSELHNKYAGLFSNK